MSRHRMKFVGAVFASLVAALVAVLPAGATAKEFAQQSNQDRGVTVQVKPIDVAADAKSWAFEVVLTTHSQDLADDLTRTAVLIDGAGKPHTALAWDGTAPGGHHRKGVLRFAPISPLPAMVELRLQRPGESTARNFRWPLK